MIFLTSNLPAMPFRTDLPINYRDEKSSGKRKRELIRSLAGSKGPHAPSHIRVFSHVSARPPHWPCHLLPPLPQETPSGPQLTPCLSLLLSLGCPSQAPACCPWAWRGCPGLGEGRELGTSRTWAVGPAGRRWKARDWQPGFYSQPALGSPFSWEAGHRGRAGRGHGPSGVCFASSRLVLARASPACGRLTGESGASAPAWASGWGCQPQEAVLPGPRGGAPDGEQEERSPRCPRPSPCWPQGAEVVSHCPLLPLQPDPDV